MRKSLSGKEMFYGHKPWEKDVILAILTFALRRHISTARMTGR
jgi:hypothetical protein